MIKINVRKLIRLENSKYYSYLAKNKLENFQGLFLVIGTQKAGTTSIFEYLAKHPQINPSLVKEVQFFENDRLYKKGKLWYCNQFKPTTADTINLDVTPSYLYQYYSAVRIKQDFPDARLGVLLRNPIHRAYSAWNMHRMNSTHHLYKILLRYRLIKSNKYNPVMREFLSYKNSFPSFEELIEEELSNPLKATSPMGIDILRRGLYADQLKQYFNLFPREQFFIKESNEFKANLEQSLFELEAFLGIDHFDWSTAQLRQHHKRPYQSKLSEETIARLKAYYHQANEDLYQLLGERFDW